MLFFYTEKNNFLFIILIIPIIAEIRCYPENSRVKVAGVVREAVVTSGAVLVFLVYSFVGILYNVRKKKSVIDSVLFG